jgi:hypothetical protein
VPQSRSERGGEEKNSQLLPGLESFQFFSCLLNDKKEISRLKTLFLPAMKICFT